MQCPESLRSQTIIGAISRISNCMAHVPNTVKSRKLMKKPRILNPTCNGTLLKDPVNNQSFLDQAPPSSCIACYALAFQL